MVRSTTDHTGQLHFCSREDEQQEKLALFNSKAKETDWKTGVEHTHPDAKRQPLGWAALLKH